MGREVETPSVGREVETPSVGRGVETKGQQSSGVCFEINAV